MDQEQFEKDFDELYDQVRVGHVIQIDEDDN